MRKLAASLLIPLLAVFIAGCEDTPTAIATTAASSPTPVDAAATEPSPVVETPAAETPTVESPAAETPVVEQPTAEPPAALAETDPHFDSCKDAVAAGYGNYARGVDPEYDWYDDRDDDGVVCEM